MKVQEVGSTGRERQEMAGLTLALMVRDEGAVVGFAKTKVTESAPRNIVRAKLRIKGFDCWLDRALLQGHRLGRGYAYEYGFQCD